MSCYKTKGLCVIFCLACLSRHHKWEPNHAMVVSRTRTNFFPKQRHHCQPNYFNSCLEVISTTATSTSTTTTTNISKLFVLVLFQNLITSSSWSLFVLLGLTRRRIRWRTWRNLENWLSSSSFLVISFFFLFTLEWANRKEDITKCINGTS